MISSGKWYQDNWNEVGSLPHSYAKISLKWINSLHRKVRITKLLEENTVVNLHDFGFGSVLLYMTLKA
jgi:hypothetical protein